MNDLILNPPKQANPDDLIQINPISIKPSKGSFSEVSYLKRRIVNLSNQLQLKSEDYVKCISQQRELYQNLLQASKEFTFLQRECNRTQANFETEKRKNQRNSELIRELSRDNTQLRQLLAELSNARAQLAMNAQLANIKRDDVNHLLIDEAKVRMNLYGVNPNPQVAITLRRWSERQATNAARWELKRNKLLQDEREHLMRALDALRTLDKAYLSDSDPIHRTVYQFRPLIPSLLVKGNQYLPRKSDASKGKSENSFSEFQTLKIISQPVSTKT